MSREAEERALLIIAGNMKSTTDVYVIFVGECSAWQYAKIGHGKDAGIRLRGVKTGCPLPVLEVMAFECTTTAEAREAERFLHDELSDLKSAGEWFKCSSPRMILDAFERAAVRYGCKSIIKRVDPVLSERRARKVKKLVKGYNERMAATK
ncbi:GIY-YIG nuclease family protein [Stenotrophomonas maltophilia]|uniref:GIY-YIG nuclease family protein n=1 Tax=Stenotrophomonas maltophilia TaxID=40324 RepID=UPI003CEE82A7